MHEEASQGARSLIYLDIGSGYIDVFISMLNPAIQL